MSDSPVGDTPTRTHAPFLERSRREYETVLVVYPGSTLGVALAVLNPDGSCQYVAGRTNWKVLKPHLRKVDLFVGCYWSVVEEARAHELAEEAKKAGCITRVEHATFHGLQVKIPTQWQRAVRTLERLVRPRGFEPVYKGWFSASYFLKMDPRLGEKL